MKTKLLSSALFLLMAASCFGQQPEEPGITPRFSLSLLAGLGMPLGDFASFEPITYYGNYGFYNIAGEAKTGWGGKFNANYLLTKKWGLTGSVYYNTFATTPKKSQELFETDQGYTSDIETGYSADSWQVSGIVLGGTYEIPVHKFRVGLKLTAGAQQAVSPKVISSVYSINDPDYVQSLIQSKMENTAFAFGAGAWLRYPLTKHLHIELAADYLGAKHNFSGKLEQRQGNNSGGFVFSQYHEIKYSENIYFLSIQTGITYLFSHTPKEKIDKTTPSRFKFSLSAGASIPVGDFAKFSPIPYSDPSADYDKALDTYTNFNTAGESKIGFGGKFGVQYVLTKKFGLAAAINYNMFKAVDKVDDVIIEGRLDNNPYTGVEYESGFWKTAGAMIGAYYEIPINKFQLGFELLTGMQNAVSPQTSSTSGKFNDLGAMNSNDSMFYSINQHKANDMAIAFNGGAYLKFNAGKKSTLSVLADYTTSSHSFENDNTEITSWGGYYGRRTQLLTTSFDKKISFVNVMAVWNFSF